MAKKIVRRPVVPIDLSPEQVDKVVEIVGGKIAKMGRELRKKELEKARQAVMHAEEVIGKRQKFDDEM